MIPYEKRILDERLKDFMGEVIPVELLPYLPCLQKTDKEAIEAKQTNDGPTIANQVLVDRLKRRDKGFQQFVQALRKCGSEHTALLLDPYYNYPIDAGDDEVADTDGSGIGYKKIGTAIDVTIKGNLLLETSADEQQPESCFELEKYLADLFKKHSSAESKKMRRDLQEYLPQGAVFVNTAKGSIIATFRLSTVEAAKKLWEMYAKGEFQATLQKVLVDDTLKEHEKIPDKPLKLNLRIGEDRFNQIQKKLADIEEEQEIDEHLRGTSSNKQEGSAAEDDGSVPEIEIDIPPVFLGNNADSLGVCELELREYQKELAAPALEGKNTIICAPTNSGKTYVAIEIAKKHLESFSVDADATGGSSRKEPKVVFIVSTVNLVLQQKERFEAHLSGKYSVGEISGAKATEIPLKYLLQNHTIVVMTAQILVNALNSKSKEEQVKLEDISLLLFDECHHAHKEHSYNRIMERYLALKYQPGGKDHLPQVVGFTASLGTGKAKSVEKAAEHILLVSANLDAEVISTVQKNQDELKEFANVPKRNVFHVPTSGQDPFEKIVSLVMNKIEAIVKGIKGKLLKSVPPEEKASQQYRQWVEEFYKDSVAEAHRFLITYAEQLREYHIALTINKSTTMKNAKKRLQTYFDSLDKEKFLPEDEKLKNLFHRAMNKLDKFVEEHGEPKNPFLMKLKELLLQHYKDVKPQQREKEHQSSSGVENGTEQEYDDEGSGGERSEVRHTNNHSEESGTKESNSRKDDKANDESQEENGQEGTVLQNEDRDDEGSGGERSEVIDNNDHSAESGTNESNSQKDDKANDESQDENGKEGTIVQNEDYTTCNGEESGGNENGSKDSIKEDLAASNIAKIEAAARKDEEEKGESGPAKEKCHEEPSQEAETSAENMQDDKSSDESKGAQKEWKGPKGILFTRTRESTSALEDWIKETEELKAVLRPEALVGSGDGNIGMTQNEQERVIKRFHTGEKNLLLATSVAEEGLDIRDCNFVIRYDMMGNEISTVQSRGRVRADVGMYSVLVGRDSGALKREYTNQFRENLMVEALSKVQRTPPEEFKMRVKNIQRKNFQDRSLKKRVMAMQKSEPVPDDVTFHCRKCNDEVCQAHNIRRVKETYHVIISSDVRDNKVCMKKHPNPKTFDDIVMNKKIYCQKCSEDWGVTALINGMEWMCIKMSSFVLQFPEPNPRRMIFKKWKDLPFSIQEATIEELLQQAQTDEAQDDLDDDFSQFCF